MKTIVINVGKEVLTGKTVNTNLTFIANELRTIGIDVTRSFVIDDIKEEYSKVLDMIDEDLVIFTGGLGPTVDDITRETVLEYYKCDTYIDKDVLDTIKSYFDRLNLEMRTTNDKQALMPRGGILIDNFEGTAPGLFLKEDNKIIILLPGPPSENRPMMPKVLELLKNEINIVLFSEGFKLVGTGESWMEQELNGFYNLHPNVNIAPYAGAGEIKYIFTSSSKADMKNAMSDFSTKFSAFIYGSLDDTLSGVVVKMLKEKGYTITSAESCTGGLFASDITKVSGSSNVFKEGYITYSNESKTRLLHVKESTLLNYFFFNQESAYEMSHNLSKITKSDISVSITGIAGPTGGTDIKPVGLVYFGFTYLGETNVIKKVFNGNRDKVRERAVIFALNEVRKKLLIG